MYRWKYFSQVSIWLLTFALPIYVKLNFRESNSFWKAWYFVIITGHQAVAILPFNCILIQVSIVLCLLIPWNDIVFIRINTYKSFCVSIVWKLITVPIYQNTNLLLWCYDTTALLRHVSICLGFQQVAKKPVNTYCISFYFTLHMVDDNVNNSKMILFLNKWYIFQRLMSNYDQFCIKDSIVE